MEVRKRIRCKYMWWIVLLSIVTMAYSCHFSEKKNLAHPAIHSSQHILIPLSPKFSIQTSNAELHRQYAQLSSGNDFPMTGILYVDGKSYRFMGGDSLRIIPLAPLSDDSCGWNSQFSYLYPGIGWEQKDYNDSHWHTGMGAYGTEGHYYPVHTAWGEYDIYVRRHFTINDTETLIGHKLYLRYNWDDLGKLYCNGKLIQSGDYTYQTINRKLTDKEVELLHKDDNVIAAYCHNKGGLTSLDFGIYKENKTYCKADTASLKRMDVEATQTHYIFQCGDVELQLDFVSPSLLNDRDVTGYPISFISYKVLSDKGQQHDVEILFDVDLEWMYGKRKVENRVEQDWRFMKCDSLYLGMNREGTKYSYNEGHAVFSQKLHINEKNGGIFILGYEEGLPLQFDGDILPPIWNKKGNRKMTDALKEVGDNYLELKEKCDEIDYQWNEKAFQSGGKVRAEQIIPSYRKFMATHRFVMLPDNKLVCFGDTLGKIKESFDWFPTLLFFNRIDWMKGLLNPVFEMCNSRDWTKRYPPYDIGTYPLANRQASEEDHAIEVTADILMMTLAIVKAENSFEYAEEHWKSLNKWGNYLKESPTEDLPLANCLLERNDELVNKALGLQAYRQLEGLRLKNE